MSRLEQRLEEILGRIEPGETRVSHPDGRSIIMSNYQLAIQDIMGIITSETKKAEVRADRKTLETIASILHGTGGKGKVTHERVVSTALSYIRNKLEMYALHESEGEG